MPLQSSQPTVRAPSRSMAQTRTHQFAIFPAPTKGLNATTPLTNQDPLTATVLNNWWVRKYGPELRAGYKRWTTNLGGIGTESSVLTLMTYTPPPGSAGVFATKLFAACANGNIYDVTAQTAETVTPTAAINIPGQQVPGRFSFVNFATGGTNYLCICSSGGGYWTYDHVGGWVDRTGTITGAGAAPISTHFDFVTLWKNRLWFIRYDTSEAYYLTVSAVTGAAALFDFGPLFIHGGAAEVISSWTLDSGNGVDDKFVVISTYGDVLVYGGTDPTSTTTFALDGRWFVGVVPRGRRFVTHHGGDLAMVTEQGVEYLSQVLQSRGLLDPQSVRDTPSYRYNTIIGRSVKDTRGSSFWAILPLPSEESIIIVSPKNVYQNALQYVFATLDTSWSTFSGMPAQCMITFEGQTYFGDTLGHVFQAFTSDTDDLLVDGTVGRTIVGSIQTSYVTDPSNPMSLKRPLLIMPMFQSSGAPVVSAQVNTEWSDANTAGSPSFTGAQGSLWNTGRWNTAIWSGATGIYFAWIGASGLGTYSSLRISVAGQPGTIFTSWKLVYESGGIM